MKLSAKLRIIANGIDYDNFPATRNRLLSIANKIDSAAILSESDKITIALNTK